MQVVESKVLLQCQTKVFHSLELHEFSPTVAESDSEGALDRRHVLRAAMRGRILWTRQDWSDVFNAVG